MILIHRQKMNSELIIAEINKAIEELNEQGIECYFDGNVTITVDAPTN